MLPTDGCSHRSTLKLSILDKIYRTEWVREREKDFEGLLEMRDDGFERGSFLEVFLKLYSRITEISFKTLM